MGSREAWCENTCRFIQGSLKTHGFSVSVLATMQVFVLVAVALGCLSVRQQFSLSSLLSEDIRRVVDFSLIRLFLCVFCRSAEASFGSAKRQSYIAIHFLPFPFRICSVLVCDLILHVCGYMPVEAQS